MTGAVPRAAALLRAGRSDAIDVLKALAILAVLVQHTVPGDTLKDLGRNLWIRPAVPVFFVLLGLNLAGSLARSGGPTSPGALRDYLVRRLDRILAPVLVTAIACYAIGAALGEVDPTPSYLLLAFPTDPPGNYFVPALIGMIAVFPLVHAAFRRHAAIALLGCLAINVAVEVLLLKGLGADDRLRAGDVGIWYPGFPLRYLFAVAVGVWIATDSRLTARRNLPLVALALPSGVFLASLDLGANPAAWFPPESYEKAMSFFAVPWALLLVLAGLRWLPADAGRSLPARALTGLGRSSFHVFLAQMIWIGAVAGDAPEATLAPVHIAASLALGWLLYRLVPDSRMLGLRVSRR